MLLVVVSIGLVIYPLFVYFGLKFFEPHWFIAGLMVLAGLRCLLVRGRSRRTALISLTGIVACVVAILFVADEIVALRFYPVAVSAVMFMLFTGSLFTGMPVIERIARIQEPDLPPAGVVYTRRLTIAWAVLILCNGLVALWTALFTSLEVWALFNGLLSYFILGGFFVLEWLFRERIQRPVTRA